MSRWNDRWQTFPASKPIRAEGGIATSKAKARGAMAETWWSQRFVDVLESYGLGGRMTRGRTYARQGQVLSLDVSAGLLVAQVQGSRRVPYAVTVRLSTPSDTQWRKIEDALRARVGYAARLLAGEVPTDLEAVFADAKCKLFPASWRELKTTCSCPDWGDPCKHQAAVLYVFADQLDSDPWRLLAWLGRTRDEIVALFAVASTGEGHDALGAGSSAAIAPWWPLRPGTAASGSAPTRSTVDSVLADDPDAVLARVGDLEAVAAGQPVADALRLAYRALDRPES